MEDLLVHIAHLLTTMAKLLRRGDAKIILAEVKTLGRSGDELIYHVSRCIPGRQATPPHHVPAESVCVQNRGTFMEAPDDIARQQVE